MKCQKPCRYLDRKQKEIPKRETDHQFTTGIRIIKLPEPVADTANQRGEKKVDNIRKSLEHLREANAPIENAIRHGKFSEKKKKQRYLFLTFSNHWAFNNVLMKSHELKDFCCANVFIT